MRKFEEIITDMLAMVKDLRETETLLSERICNVCLSDKATHVDSTEKKRYCKACFLKHLSSKEFISATDVNHAMQHNRLK